MKIRLGVPTINPLVPSYAEDAYEFGLAANKAAKEKKNYYKEYIHTLSP
jgi:guanyl-specific ribonuclease Sa